MEILLNSFSKNWLNVRHLITVTIFGDFSPFLLILMSLTFFVYLWLRQGLTMYSADRQRMMRTGLAHLFSIAHKIRSFLERAGKKMRVSARNLNFHFFLLQLLAFFSLPAFDLCTIFRFSISRNIAKCTIPFSCLSLSFCTNHWLFLRQIFCSIPF